MPKERVPLTAEEPFREFYVGHMTEVLQPSKQKHTFNVILYVKSLRKHRIASVKISYPRIVQDETLRSSSLLRRKNSYEKILEEHTKNDVMTTTSYPFEFQLNKLDDYEIMFPIDVTLTLRSGQSHSFVYIIGSNLILYEQSLEIVEE
mmetsp:Transcript_10620/g.15551  ORF Transcript_10620/g.15551 Transcript_10620/m.15551 type:complete len:148 (+) Transcript_10620:53-496(+)